MTAPSHLLSPSKTALFRSHLLRWYELAKRDLPWRNTHDPYRIWVSEIMLQQTRVAAALPYYTRFLERFPDVHALAAAAEADVLAGWAGLGYYSRARNLLRAARQIESDGAFPADYAGIRALPGIGDYTAAAVASIAFDLPHAVLDGNVARVLARLSLEQVAVSTAPAKRRLRALADELLDRNNAGEFNQALMELGATVCLPKNPQCSACPVTSLCRARQQGAEQRLPVLPQRVKAIRIRRELLVVRRAGRILLWQRPPDAGRMAGFWELPEPDQLRGASKGASLARFRHTITNHHYLVTVLTAKVRRIPPDFVWMPANRLAGLPLSTLARKALQAADQR